MFARYAPELRKLIGHGINGEGRKARLYAEQFARKLDEDGHAELATSIRSVIKGGRPEAAAALLPTSPRGLPVDGESRVPVGDAQHFLPDEIALHLPPAARQVVDRFLAFTKSQAKFTAAGVAVNPSLLVYGPPGCGKTQLARWVAASLGRPLLTARTDAIVSSYLGSTAKNVRNLFDHAVSSHAVLFLDEFDALGKMRDDARELGELKRVVISLLQNIDAAGPELVLVAATNHEHLLDPAVWRRFNFKVHLLPPAADARRLILADAFRGYVPPAGVDVLAAAADGVTGAALKHAAEDCVREAILAERTSVEAVDAAAAVLAAAGWVETGSQHGLIRGLVERGSGTVAQKQVADFLGVSAGMVSKLVRR